MIDLSSPMHPPSTPTPCRLPDPGPNLLTLLDISHSSRPYPPRTPSLPPSSPPLPLSKILNDDWPGSCSFNTICSVSAVINYKIHHEKKSFSMAFHEHYGFDKPYSTWAQHTGYLRNIKLKKLVDEYKMKPDSPWTEFSSKARHILTQSKLANK
ncbi:hypothetical protein CALVIDRAFT_568344 [Calocera viscosa TUFC12733]|uniref:Uncharacterized protein n=1 Tax=Calocera viscosa (strain TUFC12733) TaxID=1330018 RepID=A0A167H712_CALVF|nr:hypothetical protein CALVIDRAFT_568344 [Calocera viscosa TUFC12733]